MNMDAIKTPSLLPDCIRLHISPFSEELYDRIIQPSLQPLARHASFHTIQTFPEKSYGFVELPSMEAQKLKKKLNGSTLKGTKLSVEEARPAKKRKSDVEVEQEGERKKKAKRESKERRKQEDGVLTGHEMEEGRRVKRGWTGDDSRERPDRKQKKDGKAKTPKESEERKLRFKTKVPPNKAPVESERNKKKKQKKSKKAGENGQTVVEEFSKRKKSRVDVQPLNGVVPGSTSYLEGKGWVDEAGNVVEPERKSKRPKKRRSSSPRPNPAAAPSEVVAGAQDSESEDHDPEPLLAEEQAQSDPRERGEVTAEPEPLDLRPKEVHPLEALFKRPALPPTDQPSANATPNKPRPAPIDTSFSFFGGGDDAGEDVEMGGMPPVTPHTKQDLEWRSLRSAAPTPDTAAIGRKFSFPFAGDDDEDEEDEEDEMLGQAGNGAAEDGKFHGENGGTEGRGEESAFRKWFFENRGDLNRGWKKRRRDERKVRRQRENRRLGRKLA